MLLPKFQLQLPFFGKQSVPTNKLTHKQWRLVQSSMAVGLLAKQDRHIIN